VTELYCPDDVRRDRLRASTGNVPVAIDHIEVLPSRRALLVHAFAPIPDDLDASTVVIEGGVRVNPVRVLSAHRADLLPAGELTAGDQAVVTTLGAAADRALAVRTDSSGDFSTYTLRLLPPSGGTATFDPILSAAGFSFKVDCRSDFDCRADHECPPERGPAVRIDYLAKDYASFRRLMLDRLAETVPEWMERNPADLGVALVESIAYAADQLSYQQDAAGTEAYLGTSRLRPSVRRHARLLDYRLHDGCNARAWLAIEAGALSGTVIQARTPVVPAGAVAGPLPRALEEAAAQGTPVFETLHEITAQQVRDEIHIHTWGDERCCLPRGATSATLVETTPPLALAAGDVLIFEEVRGAAGLRENADPTHRHAVRLSEPPSADVDPLDQTVVLEVRWHAEDALPFALTAGGPATAPLAVVRGNVVLADHGLTVRDDPVLVPEGRLFRPELGRPAVTQAMPFELNAVRRRPADDATAVDLDATLPWVRFDGEGDGWEPRRDLLGSDAFAADFVVELEEDGRAFVRFGDATYGRRPSEGEAFQATYRVGNGPAGNVGAETLTRAIGVPAGIAVRNPSPAIGGTAPELLEAARLYAPHAFRRQERAVTEADYAAAAERHPEVQRAAARRRWTGSWHTMFVTVDRRLGKPVDAAFEARLRAHLDRFRMAGYDLEIDGPRFVPVELALRVCAAPGYVRPDVEEAVRAAMSAHERADGSRGAFHPDNFTFGQPVLLAPLVAVAMRVPGVVRVQAVRFRRWRERDAGELAAGRLPIGPLEIARLDDDLSQPELGQLQIELEGGT
jgi:hypothetical protein